MTETGM